jgi:hypothetical protein
LYDRTNKMVLSTEAPAPDGAKARQSIIRKDRSCNLPPMPIRIRRTTAIVAIVLAGLGLSGCSSINEKLAAGMSDAIPAWAGGLPADAPPRPGTAKYDEYMKERERKRLMPAAERPEEAKPASSSEDAIH